VFKNGLPRSRQFRETAGLGHKLKAKEGFILLKTGWPIKV